MCLMVADASDQHTSQHTWPLVTILSPHRIKTVMVTFFSCNSDFIRILRCCKFTIARRKSELWDKTQLPITLYIPCMAETSFHRFHMCQGKKQTHTQTYKCSLTHILTPLLLFLIQLRLYLLHPFLSSPMIFSLSLIPCVELFFHLCCCWCNRKNTWLFLQLRLESVIYKYFNDL